MAIMAESLTSELVCKVAADDVKCRNEINVVTSAAPSGDSVHFAANSNNGGQEVIPSDLTDHLAHGKKKRRRKTKRKTPYNKMSSENRGKKAIRYSSQKRCSRYKQPEAPYNSNRFLIEDHNDLKDIDVDLMAAANRNMDNNIHSVQKSPQRGRVRDSSFTSVESDEDFFYSSPEDEEEFLTKEFSNTYKDLHVEALANLSKAELIQHILCLEEKMDTTQKKLESLSQAKNDGSNGSSMGEKLTYFQEEISKLVIANKTLLHENEELRKQRKSYSESSEDSESDSSSSTCSSSSSCSDISDHEPSVVNGPHSHMNGDATTEIDNNLMDTENVT